jgi:sugar phosphate isomerase/epimerase
MAGTPAIDLGCADFTWPLMGHVEVLEHIQHLGFKGVDLGLFGNRSHLRPEVIRDDTPAWAGRIRERLDRIGLEVADVFLVPWTDLERMAANHPDASEVAEGASLFDDMLEFAQRIGAPGMTMNSGAVFPGEPMSASIRRSSDELARRVEAAARYGIQIRIEGAVGTNTNQPEVLLDLVGLTPGLKVTVDYCHFVFQGMAITRMEPLLDHVGHVQCRGAAPGRMQVPYEENAIDYGRMIEQLQKRDYSGYFSIEYVWMNLWDCNRTENTMETIRFRDFARSRLEGREYVLQSPAV